MNPNVAILIAEGIGLAVVVLSLVIQQFKKMQWILFVEMLLNFMAAMAELLKQGKMTSGAVVLLVATVNILIMLIYNRFGNAEDRRFPNVVCIVFAVLHIVIGSLSIRCWYDVLPVVGAALSSVMVLQTKARNYRIMRIANGTLWISYYLLSAGAFTLILNQALCMISALTAIWRLDIKKKKE